MAKFDLPEVRNMEEHLEKEMAAIKYAAKEVLPDILLLDLTKVSAFLVGDPLKRDGWALVDTGPEEAADFIVETARERFGQKSRPNAIILLHGHLAHAGAAMKLADFWNVPVYMHQLEMPYVTALVDYPTPDPAVDEVLSDKLSDPSNEGINLSFHAVPLPLDRSVPGMPGWEWVHTPGHTIGHVSLFRPGDRTLISGDAFSSSREDTLFSFTSRKQRQTGDAGYATIDWNAARNSIRRLLDLKPSLAIPSHGKPLRGEELSRRLETLLDQMNGMVKPDPGLYADEP